MWNSEKNWYYIYSNTISIQVSKIIYNIVFIKNILRKKYVFRKYKDI